MNKSFRSSKGRSSSSNLISLHFNKADEEQLQISYGEKNDDNSIKEESTNDPLTTTQLKKSDHDTSDNEEKLSITGDENNQNRTNQKGSNSSSRESTPSRDSVVKEYWSKISKRGSSLDSDLGAVDKTQETKEWQLFKDIKGKITKTLEERKAVSKAKDEKQDSEVDGRKNSSASDRDGERTPTESERLSLKLSPAIEASEIEDDLFSGNYIDDELHKAKCEIISSKRDTSSSSTQFYLQQPTKSAGSSITLSNLLAKRCASIETPTIEKNETQIVLDNKIGYSESVKHKPQQDNVLKHNIVRKSYYFIKSCWSHVIFRMLVLAIALLFSPVPSWLSGFVSGAFISGYIVYCLFKPGKPKEAFVLPDFSQLPPSNIPVTEIEDEPIIYKGWMNELPFDMNYNPDTYHVNCTRSIYIRLDGSYLRVSYPLNNIPRRAMFNEARHEMQFIDQQHYDITGSAVELLPVGLARKRIWSKKYPICLKIPNPKQSLLSNKSTADTTSNIKATSRKDSPIKKVHPRINDNNEVVLFLFSRTDREKDLWFYRFKKASRIKLLRSHSPSSSPNIAAMDASALENKRTKSVDLATLQICSNYQEMGTTSPDNNDSFESDDFTDLSMTKQQKFEMYMSHLLAPIHTDHSFSTRDKKDESKMSRTSSLGWLNVLIGRVAFDVLTEEAWCQLITDKIQRKLSKIKLPIFLNELIVKDINLGTALPKIHRASEPCIDQRGLWIDIDLSYNGSFKMTLETSLNLLRTKCDSDELLMPGGFRELDTVDQFLKSPVYNSDEEDSAESSSDEDIPLPDVHDGGSKDEGPSQVGGSTGKKILRLVDRFAQSTYFQNATKNKFLNKAMKDISNTPLVLTVEVQWLTGTIALNIPPMPTDRLWYGFRTNPHLSIVARPKLGQRVVTLTHVTDWIEKKLVSEFQKVLVMPNMDDLMIPIMQSDIEFPKA
ncbi:hypothetical protein JTE90_009099 [Oedothorax gibbosus]|uniref:SMP-LTD domain-containing protein n=1 Tax=Oedothorax gibbosus TaxID=931172 RepID=A0AAV6UZL1_9ARAC|nr:hypothetical protein JTE90_009099 [Oedothorax gibbosus]